MTGEPRRAHLVAPVGDLSGAAIISAARVNGTEVRALCGLIMIPTRDPARYADCDKCTEVFENISSGPCDPVDA